jgi:hypothetical protein
MQVSVRPAQTTDQNQNQTRVKKYAWQRVERFTYDRLRGSGARPKTLAALLTVLTLFEICLPFILTGSISPTIAGEICWKRYPTRTVTFVDASSRTFPMHFFNCMSLVTASAAFLAWLFCSPHASSDAARNLDRKMMSYFTINLVGCICITGSQMKTCTA